jgi:hypothetical protein
MHICLVNSRVDMEANPEHLATLRAGVRQWNAWRDQHKYILAPDLEDADLRALDLSGADLSKTNLCSVSLAGCRLDGANLIQANLSGTRMRGASLRGARLVQANCHGTDLGGADLSGADLSGTFLRDVNFDDASLTDAILDQVVFLRASLKGTQFAGARLGSVFADVDLGRAIGLEQVQHVGPTSVGVDTIYRSEGRIPESFLREAGVPENLIAYIPSFVGRPIDFQSCFISYSSTDHMFAQRLHADLRREGIRCWFAPEDLKIGQRIRREIDRSIVVHDRLLVVLSRHSLASEWVAAEVEAALERESRAGKEVLFPIRIDDDVMATSVAWAAHLRRTRHIGDFRNWQERQQYQVGFTRLLRDLRLESPSPEAR